ncbi:hypothetical protein RDV78_01515 [Bacillota bacterium LX-D]|nr:hypothetical protein [Bacillota bacterium LX-D]
MTRWKIIWLVILLMLALAFVTWGGYYYYNNFLKIDPNQLIEETLKKTLQTDSYRFHVKLQLQVDGRQVQLSDVQGEKANSKDFHIKGKMQNQDVEVFQINNVTYLKNGLQEKWIVVPDNPVFETESFLAEINPISSFNFSELIKLNYLGKTKEKFKKYYVFECTPTVYNQFLAKFWHNFKYKIWVEQGSRRIVKAEVTANSKAKPTDTLSMLVELKDYNAKIKLHPPQEK